MRWITTEESLGDRSTGRLFLTLLAAFAVVMTATGQGVTLIWDFEGRVAVENDPVQDRLYDTSGALKFHLTTPGGGDSFDRFEEGVPSNPVRYNAIDDESLITDTPGAHPLNEWLLRKTVWYDLDCA